MTVWIVTLVTAYLLCSLASYFPRIKYNEYGEIELKPNLLISGMACAVLVAVSGLRQGVGDTWTYKTSFGLLPSSIIAYTKTLEIGSDWAFDFCSVIIKNFISENGEVMIFIWSMITIVCIFLAFYKYSEWLEMSIFLFITTGCYLTSMNGIRQYIASGTLFLAFPLIRDRKWYIYFPIVVLMAQFHTSAYIFIPLYFIADSKSWGKVTVAIFLIAMILFVTYESSGPIIAALLESSKYSNYSELVTSEGAGANIIRAIVMFVPILIAFLGRTTLREDVKYYNILVNFSVINFAFILLAARFWIYARFNMYFSLYMVLLLCECIQKAFTENSRRAVTILCLICYFLYYYYEMHISLGYGVDYVHFIPALR